MRCGNCGYSKHELFETKNKDIVVKCLYCKNKSRITVIAVPSKVDVKWMKGSSGLLTVF